jgi:hypothetical protein
MGRKDRLCRWVPPGACCVLAAVVAVPMAGAHQTSQNRSGSGDDDSDASLIVAIAALVTAALGVALLARPRRRAT